MSEEFDNIDDEIIDEPSTPEPQSIAESIKDAFEEVADGEPISEEGEGETSPIEKEPEMPAKKEPKEEKPAEIVSAPMSWPAAEKERFKTLPPEVQKFISKREADRERYVSSKANEAANVSRQYQDIDQAFAPFERKMQLNGATRAQVVSQLLAAQSYLDENPKEALKWMAQSYGVTPEEIFSETSQQKGDPAIAHLQQKIAQLEGHLTNQQQQQHVNAYSQVENQIQHFASETDASGNYIRPHFNEVYNDMEAIVRQLRASQPQTPVKDLLQQAYERAVWANPSSREAMLVREKQKVQANHMSEAKRKAEKARVLGSSVTGAPSSSASPAISKDLRESLESAFSKHWQ